MAFELQKPSEKLQALLRERIAAQVVVSGLEGWPANSVTKQGLLLLHLDGVWVYGISPDGVVLAVDVDDTQQRLETALHAVNAVAQAARKFPELRELLPERPAGAIACSFCEGTGDAGASVACVCEGLGWRLPTTA